MLIYIPNKGFKREELSYAWGMPRSMVREQLELPFIPADTPDIHRDLYAREEDLPARWLLHYTLNDELCALEIKEGVDMAVEHITLLFNRGVDWLVPELETLSPYEQLSPGKYFFPALNLTIANKAACGASGDELAYVFVADTQPSNAESMPGSGSSY